MSQIEAPGERANPAGTRFKIIGHMSTVTG